MTGPEPGRRGPEPRADQNDVRCGGEGLLYEVLTPHRDPRDPAYEDREYECPGCPDCASPATDDGRQYVCEFDGHEWGDAGGGLRICVRCEAEKWADDDA